MRRPADGGVHRALHPVRRARQGRTWSTVAHTVPLPLGALLSPVHHVWLQVRSVQTRALLSFGFERGVTYAEMSKLLVSPK